MRQMPIIAPGMFLSQPPMASTPSMNWLCTAVSMESAITSRETSEYFMPSVPIEMPSVTVMVPNICGMPPAARSGRVGGVGERLEARVAGVERRVAVGEADEGLLEVLVLVADGAQHRAVGRARVALGDRGGAVLVGHVEFQCVDTVGVGRTRLAVATPCRNARHSTPVLTHPQFDPVLFSLGPVAVRWYGLMYVDRLRRVRDAGQVPRAQGPRQRRHRRRAWTTCCSTGCWA